MPCMKTSDRLATILFLLAAPAARFLELKNNYDPAGLPTGGFPYLPAVLAAAAVVFLLSARGLPAPDAVTADFGGIFRFDGQLTLTAAVLGGFLLLAAATRYVSLGSVWAGASFPFISWYCYPYPAVIALAFVIGGLVVWQHRTNIRRLLDGNENKFSFHHKTDT